MRDSKNGVHEQRVRDQERWIRDAEALFDFTSKLRSNKQIKISTKNDGLILRCPFCRDDISVGYDGTVTCGSCSTPHHIDCWFEGESCSVCKLGKKQEAKERVA